MKSLLTRMYGKVVDIEVYASTEDKRYAAVAFAAVEAVERERTTVEGVVLDLPESMGRPPGAGSLSRDFCHAELNGRIMKARRRASLHHAATTVGARGPESRNSRSRR